MTRSRILRVVEDADEVLVAHRRARYQYRRCNDVVLRRVLSADGETVITDWTALTREELAALVRMRGEYHPVLDPLGMNSTDRGE